MESDLDRVKKILLGEEYDELLDLKSEYQDSEAFAQAVSRVVAEALESRSREDQRIAQVLAPIIDGAISNSIDQDPKKLAQSLYPIMGPAIRKSISETLQQMLDNFNQLLEQSLSPKSLTWRFDAWRTGRSYSELVLLNTLEYHVEQVFLIHRETSLLIQHVYSDLAERKDPDMVSSMFSAIQDFIQDSFSVSEADVLDTLKLGELSVVIQSGPQAIVAAVVRGQMPDHLRGKLKEVSERVHRFKRHELQEFSGDTADFFDVEDDIRSVLEARQKEQGKKKFPWLAAVVIVAVLGWLGYVSWQEYRVLTARTLVTSSISQLPGVVVVSEDVVDRIHTITALVDPLADDFSELLVPEASDIAASSVVRYDYISADDAIVLRRAQLRVPEPAQVGYEVNEGVLRVTGNATKQWWAGAEPQLRQVPGVDVLTSDLELNDPVQERIDLLMSRLSNVSFEFDKEAVGIETSESEIATIASWMKELATLDGAPRHFLIVGYTDNSGTDRLNLRISQERADSLKTGLQAAGVPEETMTAMSGFDYHDSDVPSLRAVKIYPTENPR